MLRDCKSGAVFINIGRGDVIDELSLVNAISVSKFISAAILDVFENEPLPSSSPLWTLENVLITPHISGTSYPDDVVNVFRKNLERFLRKEQLMYVVDWAKEY